MKNIFEQNPKLDVVYQTSDKKYFYLENDAANHAQTLENKKVIKLERESTKESELDVATEEDASETGKSIPIPTENEESTIAKPTKRSAKK